MASMALSALALLALLPSTAAYSFDLTAPPRQCGQLTLKLSNGSGKPPYNAIVMPYGATVGNTEQRRIFQHQFSDSSTSFQLPYPQDSNFVIMVGDRDGPGTGGTSVPTTVGKSSDSSCLPGSVTTLFSFQIIPTTAINQCAPVTLAWNSSAQDPVNLILAIPGGQSSNIPINGVGRQEGSTMGFSWAPNIRAGTNIILVASDKQGVGTGGSVNTVVGFNPNNDQSCINGNSPSSTAGTPAGAVETGNSGRGRGGDDSGSSTNAGAIAGGVVGGIAGLIIVALLVWFFLRRRRIQRHPATHGVDLLPEGQRDPDQPAEFYQPEPFIVPASHSGHGRQESDDTTQNRPSMSDRRYSAISTTDQSESVFLAAGGAAGSTSHAPSSNRSRKSPAGLPQLRPVNFVQHEDAGEVEGAAESSQQPETIELPPSYTSVRK